MSFKVYDLDGVSTILGGIPIDSGWGEGAAIALAQQGESFITKEGDDGTITRAKTGNKLWQIEIALMQSAGNNAVLSALLVIDEQAGNGAGVVPLLIRDTQGLTIYAFSHVWVQKWPDSAFRREPENRVWTLAGVKAAAFEGGN